MSEIKEPHPASDGWTIEVTHLELMRVLTFARSRHGSVDDSVVWVKHTGVASRRWLIGGDHFWMWVDGTGGAADPATAVAIPVPFLDSARELAQAFGKVTVYRDKDDGRFVAYFANEELWWDSIRDHPDEWLQDDDVWFRDPVTATVDFAAIERIVSTYSSNLGGLHRGEQAPFPPFITMRIGDGCLHWTTSWTRFNQPDVSGATAAETDGEGMIAFYPLDMFRLVNLLPNVGEVSLTWESSNASEVCLCDEDWGIVCDITDELVHRVNEDLVVAFMMRNWSSDDMDGLRRGILEFKNDDGRKISVTVVESENSATDFVRMSTSVAIVEGDPGAAFGHINALNGKLAGAKLIQDGNAVFVCVEFAAPCPRGYIEFQIDELLRHAAECDGLDQFLPLFSLPPAT